MSLYCCQPICWFTTLFYLHMFALYACFALKLTHSSNGPIKILLPNGIAYYVLRENQTIEWCVGPYSTSWVLSSVTQDRRLGVVQLGSQQVEYDPIHHTNLVIFLCHGFNHVWPLNILTFSVFFKKHTTWPQSIPHGHVVPYIPNDTYQMLYYHDYVICQQSWHKSCF